MKTNSPTNDNSFTISKIFDLDSRLNYDETLKQINSYFTNQSTEIGSSLAEIETSIVSNYESSLLAAIAIDSGANRAKKAIELALSQPLLSKKNIEKSSTILLLISTGTTDVTLDEIGEINDHTQLKVGFSADIIMSVEEDVNLGEAIAVTIVLCYSNTFK